MKFDLERWISTLAIVLGLIFVGFELRQNTASIRGATMQAISDTHVNWTTQMAVAPELNVIMHRIHNEDASLEDFSTTERMLILGVFNSFIQQLENSFLQYREGLVSDAVFESYGWQYGLIQTRTFGDYWEYTEGEIIHPEFAKFMSDRVQIGPSDP